MGWKMVDLFAMKKLSFDGIELKQLFVNGIQIWKRGYTNRVPISIDTDGSIYNGVGYLNGYRLSSSGAIKGLAGSTVSGYIPVHGGDMVRIVGIKWLNTEISLNYLCGYDANFNHIGALYSMNGGQGYGTQIWTSIEDLGEMNVAIALESLPNLAYIRVSSATDFVQDGVSMIVTVNEPVTEM